MNRSASSGADLRSIRIRSLPKTTWMRWNGLLCLILLLGCHLSASDESDSKLAASFERPPDSARPWVYWYFMDGNLTRQGMTADLKAMKRAGIGGAIFLEVNLGIPRGPVQFMSKQWLGLVKHAVNQADRLGLQIALGAGPGWCGTGGPWVSVENSMQDLVASETNATGPGRFDAVLPLPKPHTPFFGEGTLTPELRKQWSGFYSDVCVLAFPTPQDTARIPDIDEKALYRRAPYSSQPGVKPRLPAPAEFPSIPAGECIATNRIVDLSGELSPDGHLNWNMPPGHWTVLRFGRRSTGQVTRPAPLPGLGFECDKFDPAALDSQLDAFDGKILKTIGPQMHSGRGVTDLHFDSWEMNSQNWTGEFRQDFQKRRGYDLLPFLPVFTGRVVESDEMSERFLWDVRRTAQELVVENHVGRLREFAHHHGLTLSIEPYDMNPAGDLTLGSAADIPMGEFWAQGFSYPTTYSCFEAVSLGHTLGRSIIGAESFTANPGEDWRLYPGAIKAQADWALCAGINRIVIHRYAAQPWLDRWPGMTMGPYGVHWERTQTWWNMVPAFHRYLTRCQMMLRRGLPVADILYLDAEGAPDVFRAPASALLPGLPDRRGYNFDGCAPDTLITKATVKNGRIVFPGGMSYRILVLPELQTMTPKLLRTIQQLIEAGATVIGAPPQKSPSLENYPQCDGEVKRLATEIWGSEPLQAERSYGEGDVILDTNAPGTDTNLLASTSSPKESDQAIYPDYEMTASVLCGLGVPPDFESTGDVRYTHRHEPSRDIYFIANRTAKHLSARCHFRVSGLQPELWDPVTGERRVLPDFREEGGRTTVPLQFAPAQSYFVVFRKTSTVAEGKNFSAHPNPERHLGSVAGFF